MTSAAHDPHIVYWCHCEYSQVDQCRALIKQLHLDDAVGQYVGDLSYLPQLNDTDDTITIKIQAPQFIVPDKKKHILYNSLVIHLTSHVCFTFTNKPIYALGEFAKQSEKSLRYAKTPGFILFLVLDNILNDYAKILLALESYCDEMDNHLRSFNHKNHFRMVTRMKHEAIRTNVFWAAIRDILMRISGRKITVISEACRKSLVDLYNHSMALVAESDSIREVLNGMLDQIDNNIMYRMSESMKYLTAYATIFMPPTLIAGIYGMNFSNMPELQWQYGYYIALGLIFLSGLVTYFIFQKTEIDYWAYVFFLSFFGPCGPFPLGMINPPQSLFIS